MAIDHHTLRILFAITQRIFRAFDSALTKVRRTDVPLFSTLFTRPLIVKLRIVLPRSPSHRSPYFRRELLHTRLCCILPSTSFSTFRACCHGCRCVAMRPAASGPRSGRKRVWHLFSKLSEEAQGHGLMSRVAESR